MGRKNSQTTEIGLIVITLQEQNGILMYNFREKSKQRLVKIGE